MQEAPDPLDHEIKILTKLISETEKLVDTLRADYVKLSTATTKHQGKIRLAQMQLSSSELKLSKYLTGMADLRKKQMELILKSNSVIMPDELPQLVGTVLNCLEETLTEAGYGKKRITAIKIELAAKLRENILDRDS